MNKKTFSSLVVLLILVLSYFLKTPEKQIVKNKTQLPTNVERKTSTDSAKVVRVIDGDTIELENKPSSAEASKGRQKVRYIGIDTPELHDPRKPVQCFAQEAYEKNKELVEGKVVTLEKDVSDKDKYGRLLRYVYLPQESRQTTSSGLMINDYLVRQGYAYAVSYPPDIKYQDQFKSAQQSAREKNLGLWSQCK